MQTLIFNPTFSIRSRHLRHGAWLVACAGLLWLPFHLARANWSDAYMHDYHDAEILAHGVLDRVKPNAVVFCWWGPSAALWYGKYVEGLRPDVDVYDDSKVVDLGWHDSTVGMALFYGKRPIYTAPYGDQHQFYQTKFRFRLVADLHVFGQSLYELVARNEAPAAKVP